MPSENSNPRSRSTTRRRPGDEAERAYRKALARLRLCVGTAMLCADATRELRGSVALFQPGADLRPELFLGRAAHQHPDMSCGKSQIAFVLATHEIDQRQTRGRKHHVIELADRVEQRANDVAQLHALAAHAELALLEQVVLKKIPRDLAEYPSASGTSPAIQRSNKSKNST